ncbi:MAG: aminoacyltransferase [Candidatus Thermoplasmatota archaeon]|nr:aminoacyltransferase [Candidatus Thermoplasmatota archaeon]
MQTIDKKILMFNIREVHFSDIPYDMDDCDFLKFQYCKNKVDVKGFTRKKELTIVIDLTQNLDTIWQNMDKKQVRYRINHAQDIGIRIRKNEEYDKFFQMYRLFIKKKGIKSLFNVFGVGSTTLESMKKNGTLFVAEYNGEMLVGTLCLEDGSHIESLLSGSKRLDADDNKKKIISCADRLIDWEIIKYAKEKDIREYDMSGIWSEEEVAKDTWKAGINNYKLAVGGKVVTCYSYQKIYSKIFRLISYIYGLKNLGRQV